jgi:hypothetical protein
MPRPSAEEIAAKRAESAARKAENQALQKAAQSKLRAQQAAQEQASQITAGCTGGVDDPDTYKTSTIGQHIHRNEDIEDIFLKWDEHVSSADLPKYQEVVRFLVEESPTDADEMKKAYQQVRRRFHCSPKRSELLHVLSSMVAVGAFTEAGELANAKAVGSLLIKKSSKSESGVLVITVLTSPYPTYTIPGKEGEAPKVVTQRFSCQWNCYYCPNEPDQPRSYLHDEPAVLRANQNRFDPVLQFMDRAVSLAAMGHPVDKIELLVLGGTWASYPHLYQVYMPPPSPPRHKSTSLVLTFNLPPPPPIHY